jgi:hypothetical protein
MTFLRQYVRTRALIDYPNFLAEIDNGVVLCTSQAMLSVIRVLLTTYGMRYANWVYSHTPGGYIGVSPEQFDIIDENISAFLEETNDMSFCSELTEAFNNLTAAFREGCCDSGSYGAGKDEPPSSGNEDDELDWPPGFDTYAEYRAYKCDIANRIIEGIRVDVVWLAAGTIGTLAGSIVIATLLTPIPGDEILALVGFALALLAQGVLASVGASLQSDIDTERQELVCILYDAVDAGTAKTAVLDYLDSVLTVTEMALFSSLWSFASVNALFDKDVLLETSPLASSVSCVACDSECIICATHRNLPVTSGIFTIVTQTSITMTSGVAATTHWGICEFNSSEADPNIFCGPGVELLSYALGGFTPWSSEGYRIYNSAMTQVYNSSTPPDWSLFTDVRRVQLKSTTAFTGTITLV